MKEGPAAAGCEAAAAAERKSWGRLQRRREEEALFKPLKLDGTIGITGSLDTAAAAAAPNDVVI